MTTVIDHAIAIPTRPANVWDLLKDISNNPSWHPDSQRIQHLTTMKSGRGMRWRNTTKSNKEQVLEITAWYEGLGYEYRIVDGSKYTNNRGRIRLQEAPEGTVLQWTFSYETTGFFSNLRNNLSMKGQADKEIVQGLRNIYTMIKDMKVDEAINPEASKAYLKEAPNVEERASYQPRYPVKVSSQEIPVVKVDDDVIFRPPATQDPLQPDGVSLQIDEPPIADDDTRPNPSVQANVDIAPITPPVTEPDFLKAMPDARPDLVQPKTDDETLATKNAETDNETRPAPVSNLATDTVETEFIQVDDESTQAQAISPFDEPAPSKLDTSTVSVFELFGLEKPSETENVRTIPDAFLQDDAPDSAPVIEEPLRKFMDSAPIIPDIQPDVPNRRRGLRASMRRRFKNIRVPKSD